MKQLSNSTSQLKTIFQTVAEKISAKILRYTGTLFLCSSLVFGAGIWALQPDSRTGEGNAAVQTTEQQQSTLSDSARLQVQTERLSNSILGGFTLGFVLSCFLTCAAENRIERHTSKHTKTLKTR